MRLTMQPSMRQCGGSGACAIECGVLAPKDRCDAWVWATTSSSLDSIIQTRVLCQPRLVCAPSRSIWCDQIAHSIQSRQFQERTFTTPRRQANPILGRKESDMKRRSLTCMHTFTLCADDNASDKFLSRRRNGHPRGQDSVAFVYYSKCMDGRTCTV